MKCQFFFFFFLLKMVWKILLVKTAMAQVDTIENKDPFKLKQLSSVEDGH